MHFDQAQYDLKCEWALEGVNALLGISDVVIIIDILSFSTAVDIAVSRGATVFPFRWRDQSAKAFAATKEALLAAKRGVDGEYTLSPVSLSAIPAECRLVLPSPNGSTLCFSTGRVPTFTACLRNAPAVARRASARGSGIAVIPAGERWPDETLRPCLEDFVGADAVLAELPGTRSPEAEMAIAAFFRFRAHLREMLRACGSGRELIETGFAGDVDVASEYDVSSVAPILIDDRFSDDVDAASQRS